MADSTAEVPIWGDELEDYINIGTAADPDWQEVTNLLSWDNDDDQDTYEPKYIDTKAKKKYITGKSASVSYEKDAYRNNALDAFLIEHEDDANIPCEVMRVRTWQAAGSGKFAKKAAFSLTPKQLDKNTAGEPVKLTGDLSMTDADWTRGVWYGSSFATEEAATDPGSGSGSGDEPADSQ